MARHADGRSRTAEQRLWLALAIISGITILELIGGFLSQSLSLLSDAGHIFTDVLALSISILTLRLARRPHSARRTFGYHRAEIFAALINGSTLIAIAFFIIYQAYLRIIQPAQVQGTIVVVIAAIALAANLGTARLLLHHRETSLNISGIFLHSISDVLSSVAVIVGALIILLTGYFLGSPYLRADPIIATIIGVLILRSAYSLTRESLDILLEATPRHLSLAEVSHTIMSVDGVKGVHDLHIWTITSGLYALSCHLTVSAHTVAEASLTREKVARRLAEKYDIEHVTLQIESESLETLQHDEGLGL